MIRIAAFLFLILLSGNLWAQATLSTRSKKAIEMYKEADNYRVRRQFPQAIQLLEGALAKDKHFFEAYYRLGLVYFAMKQFDTAAATFEKGLSLTDDPNKQKVFWYDLGETYLNLANYEKAAELLAKYLDVENRSSRNRDHAQMMLASAQFAIAHKANTADYQQHPLSPTVNCFAMQYFPVLTADQQELIFTRRQGFTDEYDEDLVVCTKKGDAWSAPTSISKNINSMFNEGTCTISADGRKLIFTSCVGRKGYGSCDLFQSIKVGDEWSKPENMGPMVNSADWESQPSLSADGRTLYFVSDRRGGYGRRDIWVSKMNDKDEWTRAVNAGKQVNSQFDEISPFIHVNNKTLYFASNGLPGFGGYDIFYLEKNPDSKWSEPVNVGAPVNDNQDQFSLFITADGQKGYYVYEENLQGAQNPSGHASSKIYEMSIPADHQLKFKSNYVKGVVRDKESKAPLGATIELINLNTNEVESAVRSDSVTGAYLIVLTEGAEYALYVNKKGYLFQSQYFNYSAVKDFQPIVRDVELDKVREGSIAVLENIFFDTDQYELKPKSVTELNKVVRFLEENPAVRIEISGHTDNTGAAAYNRELSKKRAQAVYQYLVNKGIAAARLDPKGYGPDKPVAANDTEAGKQQNRRIEFKILKGS